MKKILLFCVLFMSSICVAQKQKLSANLNVLALDKKDSSAYRKHIVYSEGFDRPNKNIPYDSIPANVPIVINGIRFQHKEILKFIANYTIVVVDKKVFIHQPMPLEKMTAIDTTIIHLAKPILETTTKEVIVTQHDDDLLEDFFFFDDTNLIAHRYRCYAENPIFDFLMDKGNVQSDTPIRFIVDGRLQEKTFEPSSIKMSEVVKVNIHDHRIAERFWGRDMKNGLVIVETKAKVSTTDFTNKSIRVIGEKQSEKGEWIIEKDTILTNEAAFRAFREETIFKNSAMYMINGKPESEYINRKNVDIESIGAIEVKTQILKFTAEQDEANWKAFHKNQKAILDNDYAGMKQYADYKKSLEPPYYKDSVFIKMTYSSNSRGRRGNLGAVQSDLRRMRRNGDETLPIYIVDEKEVSIEVLKKYKSDELEMIAALEGCDAISKYGKRGEKGVVIYKRKQ
jgi:hypothetical protein